MVAIAMPRHTGAVAQRVLRQLIHDRRFLAFSLAIPVIIVFLTKILFDSLESPLPFIDVTKFILPVGAFIVHFITYILCAVVLVRERTAETLARAFINGYGRIEIIGGYVLAYTLLATVQTLLVLGGMSLLYNLDYSLGTLLALYLVTWLLAVISIALGIFVSNFARNEGQVFPFIPLVIIPTIFFSGVLIPVERLPNWAAPLELITPLYYANAVIQGLIQAGGTLGDNLGHLIALPMYGLIILLLATLTLRERD
jgi:ABC-2 type transport system permease protein